MTNKLAFEALDRTFRDLMSSNVASARDILFGGKVIVLGGDFRQVLPVIPKGTRAEIVMTSINSSILWKHCSCGNQKEDKIIVYIPSDLLIPPTDNPIQDIVSAIYSNIHDNYGNVSYFQERAILAPTVDIVQQINDFVVDSFPGLEKVYLSSDSICSSDCQGAIDTDRLITEFLNQITCSGIPKHALKLKKGVLIILLRNIDQANGLCNGTRLIVQDLGENIIGAEIVSGSNIGDKIFIPRMNLIPSDPGIPFKFQRRQFPVSLCFTMTINKSQGQTLALVGIYLRRAVFSHGQLYVAISRVTTRSGLKILLSNEDDEMCNLTSNVVYKEVFQKI
nr:ATP-dependent DNA helicase PIF1-like [Arachis hypogaea]